MNMKNKILYRVIAVLLTGIAFAAGAMATPLQDGKDAYTRKDYAAALSILRPLAEGRADEASITLGTMYYRGEGVARDHTEAAKWFSHADKQARHPAVQVAIGSVYRQGDGVLPDYQEARNWYRLAAVQGYALGQIQLGMLYYAAQGVSQDYVRTYMWASLAKDNATNMGIANLAQKILNFTEPELTPQQISDAKDMAKKCRASTYRDCGE